jgi:hypothetical protein
MAYRGVDPWRLQYFVPVPCPPGVEIPIDEASAWQVHPELRHIHNKLWICASQGLAHGPHGVSPPRYPVFSKPIYNMRGMGTGSRVLHSRADYDAALTPGHMWMRLLRGQHLSTDVAVLRGKAKWWRHTTATPLADGTFDDWHVEAARMPALERYLAAWSTRHLANFTGIVNFETIAGRIIECHLRMSEQWLDLNGEDWLAAVTELYGAKRWRYADGDRRDGWSIVLFGPHGRHFTPPPRRFVTSLRRSEPAVSSIQITFEASRPEAQHAMPPGGFRLAIVNAWDRAAGRRVRARLAEHFGVAPPTLGSTAHPLISASSGIR